jgi:hypothetical protein
VRVLAEDGRKMKGRKIAARAAVRIATASKE